MINSIEISNHLLKPHEHEIETEIEVFLQFDTQNKKMITKENIDLYNKNLY